MSVYQGENTAFFHITELHDYASVHYILLQKNQNKENKPQLLISETEQFSTPSMR